MYFFTFFPNSSISPNTKNFLPITFNFEKFFKEAINDAGLSYMNHQSIKNIYLYILN